MPKSKVRKNRQEYAPKPITRNNTSTKKFSYEKELSIGPTTLSFTLRTDVVEELEAFKELMIEGLKDIEEEIAKHHTEELSTST